VRYSSPLVEWLVRVCRTNMRAVITENIKIIYGTTKAKFKMIC
jgi:hypothetical protein